MDLLILLVRFLLVLAVLVLVHELGHFVTAKLFRVKVLEFGFGFPPRAFGITRGETTYSLNWLPLGGFVKLLGEEDPSDPQSLAARPPWQRAVVLVAGPLMNLLLVVVLFSIVLAAPHRGVEARVVIQEVQQGTPAEQAGLLPGDQVLNVDGRNIDNVQDLIYRVRLNLGDDTRWVVRRTAAGGTAEERRVQVTPRWRWPADEGPTGIRIAAEEPRVVTESEPPWRAIPLAVVQTGENLLLLKNEVTRWVIGAAAPEVAGPVGIAQATDEVAEVGFTPLLGLMALLSLSLAILNILPIPMLDGGRLMFVVLEWVRGGRRISPQRESLVHLVGFMLLMALLVVITYNDILRAMEGQSLLQ